MTNRAERFQGIDMNIRALLLVGLFVGVIFGVTLVSQFSFTTTDTETDNFDSTVVQPLRFVQRNEIYYQPESFEPSLRFFPGFFEVSQEETTASFWFQNVNPTPVKFGVVGRSCSSCTAARLAVVPESGIETLLNRKSIGLPPVALQFGALPIPDLSSVLAAAALLKPLKWQEFSFAGEEDAAVIPPGTPEVPTWAVFQMGVQVKGVGPKSLTANVLLRTEKLQNSLPIEFKVTVIGMHPFQVSPELLDFGNVPITGSPRSRDVIIWSATRPQASFTPPQILLDNPDGLFAMSAPVPLTDLERQGFEAKLMEEGRQAPVLGAYRLEVTSMPKPAPGQPVPLPDIGPFERTLSVTGPNAAVARITLKGTITGLVELAAGNDLKLGRYNGNTGTTKTVTLISDLPALELETVPAETRPDTLKVDLEPMKSDDGRKRWTLKVTVPPGSGFGDLPATSAVVLRSKGEKPQRIRIPIQGSAGLR